MSAKAVADAIMTKREILFVMIGLMSGMFLSALDQTVVSTSMRTIADDLDGMSLQAWVTTAYMIMSTISTPLYGKLGFAEQDLKNVADSIKGLVPAGRFGEASEIAKAVVFLASDEAAYTVGSELMIDGGMGTL